MDQFLSVEEATNTVYTCLEGFTGWKFLKSQRCLKKKINNLELCIDFYTSKWNRSHEYVGLNAEFNIVYKKLGKQPVQSKVAYYEYHPKSGDDTYWYDISTKNKLTTVIEVLECEIQNTALRLADQIENDLENAIRILLDDHFEEYHVKLEFISDILGVDAIMPRVNAIVKSLSDDERQQILDYRNGKRTKQWMFNPTDLRFIVDNNLVD